MSPSASTFFAFAFMASTTPDLEVEPMVPRIINEPKEENDMAMNLRASFKERQHKRLSESIVVATPLAKRPCPDETREASTLDTPLIPMPPADVIRPNNMLVAKSPFRKDTYLTQDGAPTGPDLVDDDLDKKNAIFPLRVPNWEEMLKQVPCFIEVEPPSTKIPNFFSLTK